MTPTPTLIERAEAWLAKDPDLEAEALYGEVAEAAGIIYDFVAALKSPRPTLDVEGVAREVRDAAQAVIDRWDAPSWKDLPATAEHINRLRLALALIPSTDGWRATHRHVGRGSCYQVIAFGALQTAEPIADETPVTIYLAGNGAYFVRPTAEFNDGRFVALPPPPHSEGGK